MINIKKITISLAVATALSFSGCGSSSSDDTSPEIENNDVTVERGATYDANVTDANGQVGEQKNGENVYTFATTPKYPISVNGGWIDVDGDGELTTEDVELKMTMKSYSKTVTPVTTYISDANQTVRENKLKALATLADTSETELLKVASEADTKAILVINAVYQEMKDQNTTNVATNTIQTTLSTLENVDLTGITSAKDIAKKIEAQTMSNLITKGKIAKLTMNEMDEIQKFKVFGITWKNRKKGKTSAKRSYQGNTVKIINDEIVMTANQRTGNWSSRAELRAKLEKPITEYTATIKLDSMADNYGKAEINAYFKSINPSDGGWKQLQTSMSIRGNKLSVGAFWESDSVSYQEIEWKKIAGTDKASPMEFKDAILKCKVSIIDTGVKFEITNLNNNKVYPATTIDLSSEQIWTDSEKKFQQLITRSVFDDRTDKTADGYTDYSKTVMKLIDLDTK